MRRGTTGRVLAGLLACGALSSCNGTTSTLGTLPAAGLIVTVVPDPILSRPAGDPQTFDFDIQWAVTVSETAGVGGTLHFVTASLYDPASGAKIAGTSLNSAALLAQFGADHIAPRGTLTVQQHLSYRLPSRTKGALLSVAVEMADDNANLLDPAVLVEVE